MFAKRAAKAASKRRKAAEDEEEETSREGPVAEEAIMEVKVIQKLRRKPKGLKATTEAEADAEYGNDGGTAADEHGLLDQNFQVQGEKANESADPYLEEFLAERLGAASGPSGGAADLAAATAEAARAAEADDAELYVIPPQLLCQDKTAEHADKMNWVTGLVEVELPLEYKLKNIEETEKAKRKILKLGGPLAAAGSGVANGTEDQEVRRKAFGSRFLNTERAKSNMATDDQTLDRFRKRFRR